MMKSVEAYFAAQPDGERRAKLSAINFKGAFDALMEGAAMMLDLGGKVEYTYVTKSGNTVHMVLDSP